MFQHSVRVPRNYKIAANIVKKVSTEGGSVKTLLYDDKLRHFRTNVLYALINETIRHSAVLDKIFENCNLLNNEPRLDPWLAKVLAAEILYGKKYLPGNSKPEQTIASYKEQLEKFSANHQDDSKTEVINRPRYIRINTNLLTTSDAIRAFQDEGYNFIRCTSGSYEDYLKQIQGLSEYDFTQDYHVKTVYVFAPGTKFHDHELYLENKIILQDKATTLPVHLLAPPTGSTVLDLCAAPGMKTTQLAAYMRNQGKIYAVERNERRYDILREMVEKSGSKCVETIHKDAFEIKRGDFDDVEYIILDPSCSGSGMDLSVHNYIDATRLAKLTSLQEKFLKHAMNAFPKAKKIVYSTCSLFPEENERVVTNVVKNSRSRWRVQDVKELLKGQWNNVGSNMYGVMGVRCLYAKPETDLTTGFFLAVLERDPRDLEKPAQDTENEEVGDVENKDNIKLNRKNEKGNEADEDLEYLSAADFDNNEGDNGQKKKKHKHKKADLASEELDVNREDNIEDVSSKPKKKRKKYRDMEAVEVEEIENVEDVSSEFKKKKKKRDIEAVEEEVKMVEIAKKKKKKQHKNNEAEAQEFNADNIHEVTHESKNKRKKENLLKKEIDIEDSLEIDKANQEFSETVLKKKKRDRNEAAENNNSGLQVDTFEQPKKKKRDKSSAS